MFKRKFAQIWNDETARKFTPSLRSYRNQLKTEKRPCWPPLLLKFISYKSMLFYVNAIRKKRKKLLFSTKKEEKKSSYFNRR
jgi:hypothetical protein